MRAKSLAKMVGAAALSFACILGVSACSGEQVAATVNGVTIAEATITSDIEKYRSSYGMDDADTWAQYLSYYGYTPSTVREEMINSYVEEEIIKEEAKANNITVDSSEVDSYVNQVKSYYSDDAAWTSALESAGLTEQTYRENIEQALMEQALMDVVTPLSDVSDEDVLSYASMYAQYSYTGAKKSSHILIKTSDSVDEEAAKAKAQEILDQINAGTLDFAEAAKQYSEDTGSAADGGNVGWDCLNSFVDEYQDALDELEVGQVSGLVTSSYGVHIIMCTEEFIAPDEITDLSQIPSEMVDSVRESVKSYQQQSDFSTWLEDKVAAADVKINDMPSGLSYDVDMSAYTTDNTTNTNTNTNTDASNTSNANNEATNENNTNSNSSN